MGREAHTPITIGIGGGSASGKSRATTALEEALSRSGWRTRVFRMDSYFKRRLPKVIAPFSGREYPDYNRPDSFEMGTLLADIQESLHRREADVLLIEGLMALQYDGLRQLLDLKVFVDADPDERIVRRLRRNMVELGLTFDEIADYYLDSVRFRHQEFVQPSKWYADIILNGSQWSDTAVEVLVSWVNARRRRK